MLMCASNFKTNLLNVQNLKEYPLQIKFCGVLNSNLMFIFWVGRLVRLGY